jgi:hypothetical protein
MNNQVYSESETSQSLPNKEEASTRPEGTYCEPTVLFDQKTSEEIDWEAYYGF